ncbi:cytochrome b-c1 complex subunit 8-like [Liolophura sinensis]|uniref:cytochrome b-c1 complex subunit 8-like n=1 Tax=Liolophura sinensis TaxID=3198878 RepID=UPI00315906A2
MGRSFGNLYKVHGLVSYSLSPYEQKAFAGAISHGIPNMFRRFRGQVFRVVPPLIIGYMVYDWGKKENARLSRKNPADFADEK